MTIGDGNKNKGNVIVKYRIYTTLCLIVTFYVMGLTGGVIGPSFVHLERVLKTDTQGLGLSFIGENLGYLTGSILCGCIFDVLNRELQLSVACLLLALSIGTAPWSPYVWVYCVIVTIQNLASGYLESCIQSYILRLWEGHKLKGAITQAVNAVWLFGSFICPFIVLPFLSDLPDTQQSIHQDSLKNASEFERSNGSLLNFDETVEDWYINITNNSNLTSGYHNDNITQVRYAYLVVALLDIVAACMLIIGYCLNGPSLWSRSVCIADNFNRRNESSSALSSIFRNKQLKVLFLVLIAIHVAVGMIPFYVVSVYISAFVIKKLQWDVTKGPLITSLYRGCNGIGGLMAIPVSLFLSHTKMLILNMSLAVLAFTVMLCISYVKQTAVIMWLSTAIAGIAVSTLYTSMLLWGSDYVSVTARYGTLLVAASAAGSMAAAPLTGYLFQMYSPMWLVYFAQGSSVFILLLFVCIYTVGKQSERK